MRNLNFDETEMISLDIRVDEIRSAYDDFCDMGDNDEAMDIMDILTRPDTLLTLTGIKPSTSLIFEEHCGKCENLDCNKHPFDFESFYNIKSMMDNKFEDEFDYIEQVNDKTANLFVYNKKDAIDLLMQNIDMFSDDDSFLVCSNPEKLLSHMIKEGDSRMGIVYGYGREDVEKFMKLDELIDKIPNFRRIIGDNPNKEMMHDKKYLQILSDYYTKDELSLMRCLIDSQEFVRIFLKDDSKVEGYLHATWDFNETFSIIQDYTKA